MLNFIREKWKWFAVGLVMLGLLLQFGGKTVVVINQVAIDLCEVHVSKSADQAQWGPDRAGSPIINHQSRDIHLPLYLTLFSARPISMHAWVVDCDGNIVQKTIFEDFSKSLVIWEIKK